MNLITTDKITSKVNLYFHLIEGDYETRPSKESTLTHTEVVLMKDLSVDTELREYLDGFRKDENKEHIILKRSCGLAFTEDGALILMSIMKPAPNIEDATYYKCDQCAYWHHYLKWKEVTPSQI